MQHVDRLFASDLDGTLIPARGGQERALARFSAFVHEHPSTCIVYVTGRSFEHAREGIETAGLPWPDHLCTSVGTDLRSRSRENATPSWAVDEEFRSELSRRLDGHVLAHADDVVTAHPGVRRQPDREQGEFKRSFSVERGIDVRATARILQSALEQTGLRCSVLASTDPLTQEGLLDLLPPRVSKATVVEYLMRARSLPPESVMFAGDSGNDLAALCGPWRGILVGNARSDLHARVRAAHTVVTRATVLEGVLEGLRHWGWLGPEDSSS